MADPQTGNIGLYLPTRGSDVDTWDLPENANDSATDSLFAHVATISLTNAPVTLTTPPNSGAAWSGPYQSQSGILKFTGTLTNNCTITIPRAGFFIVDNECVVGNFAVTLASAAPGKVICAPPGAPTHIFCDGTDVKYVNLGPVGASLDLVGATALPAWISQCTTLPYLVKDGSIYNYSDYPTLGRQLGSTFGGNGITTFGVPDERNRMRIPIDFNAGAGFTNRITTVGCGIDGKTMNAAGGDQALQSHGHGITDPGHSHSGVVGTGSTTNAPNSTTTYPNGATTIGVSQTGIAVIPAGGGASQNVQPGIVSCLALIKT